MYVCQGSRCRQKTCSCRSLWGQQVTVHSPALNLETLVGVFLTLSRCLLINAELPMTNSDPRDSFNFPQT